jgi:hypothetical protein
MSSFFDACADGNLEKLKKLNRDGVDVRSSFCVASLMGHIRVVKWLLSVKRLNDDIAFQYACANGQLHVAKLLSSIEPSIDLQAHHNVAFREACQYRRLHVAKWLQRRIPTLNNKFIRGFCSRRVVQLASFY